MSDNDSNWESCMNWVGEGCYHVGTIEMMNSNNVIVCYVTNRKDWVFDLDSETGESYLWNNKKWRQLAYATPEIIMTGKSYPYNNKQLSFTILEALEKLAKENLGITYEFGIERYDDMKYINSIASMNRARYYRNLPADRYHKKNIIFDTKGMYNDMLNDHSTTYWCKRNKVKKTTVISVSGKAKCLCCGENILTPDYDWYNYDETSLSYNERYTNCGNVICPECEEKKKCAICHDSDLRSGFITYTNPNTGAEIKMCPECYKYYIKECPICGEKMFAGSLANKDKIDDFLFKNRDDSFYNPVLIPTKPDLNPEEYTDKGRMFPPMWQALQKRQWDTFRAEEYPYYPVFAHPECIEKKYNVELKQFDFTRYRYAWNKNDVIDIYTKLLPYEENWEDKYKDIFYTQPENN
jgi:hypothetical protein